MESKNNTNGNLLKNITKLHNKIFAEKNRNLFLNDYVQQTEPIIKILEKQNTNGKKIRIYCDYVLDSEVNKELLDYYKNVLNDEEISTKYNFSKFTLSTSLDVDFRGYRSQEQKDDKIKRTISDITESFNSKLDQAVITKIFRLNKDLDDHLAFYNNDFENYIIDKITNINLYTKKLQSNKSYIQIDSQYNHLLEQINALNVDKNELEQKITNIKRSTVLESLNKLNWNLPFNGEVIKIPKSIIEKTKNVISNSYKFEDDLI
jgi:hypothetical protein